MLRKALLAFAALLILGGIVIALCSHTAAGLGPAIFGAILLFGTLFERSHYKRIEDHIPGPDWQPTGERFLDPGSDAPIAVYFQPTTGKRIYVRTAHT
jgi:hypothetical protein